MKTHNIWPTLLQVLKIIEYKHKKRAHAHMHKDTTILKSLNDLLQTTEFNQYMLTPKKGECTLIEIEEDEPLLLVLFLKQGGSFVWQWGQWIVGLNGIYKLTKPGWPFWVIIVEDANGHRWPVTLIITLTESKEILAHSLKIMCDKEEKELGVKWKLIVQINKDEVERGAVMQQEGWTYLLCQFHVAKIWSA